MENTINFNYGDLCRQQQIQVAIPENIYVSEAEADTLLDLILRASRIKKDIVRLKINSLNELKFAKEYNMQIHGLTYTTDVGDISNKIYKAIINDGGLQYIINKLTDISYQMQVTTQTLRTCVDLLYNETHKIIAGVLNKRTLYERYGSENGYTPYLDVNQAIDICQRAIYLENTVYDFIYVASTVALSSLAGIYGEQAGNIVQTKLKSYSLFDGESQEVFGIMIKSFKPESRFDIEEFELGSKIVM